MKIFTKDSTWNSGSGTLEVQKKDGKFSPTTFHILARISGRVLKLPPMDFDELEVLTELLTANLSEINEI